MIKDPSDLIGPTSELKLNLDPKDLIGRVSVTCVVCALSQAANRFCRQTSSRPLVVNNRTSLTESVTMDTILDSMCQGPNHTHTIIINNKKVSENIYLLNFDGRVPPK